MKGSSDQGTGAQYVGCWCCCGTSGTGYPTHAACAAHAVTTGVEVEEVIVAAPVSPSPMPATPLRGHPTSDPPRP
jgi:hypothetical protein